MLPPTSTAFSFWLYLENRIWFFTRVNENGGEKMSELLKRLQTGQRHIEEYTRPNADFICPVCNQKSPCYASFVTLQAGYGSVHDGEKAKVRVCGECIDRLFEKLETK
jgi:membrane protease subunit (stomatin/prohibitin family)